MKLAEALLLRGDLQKKLASLRERIVRNGLVQEGNAPHEDPNALLLEAAGVIDEHDSIIPHLTVAHGSAAEAELAAVELAAALRAQGPIASHCARVELLENSSGRWRPMHTFALR